MGDSKKDKDKDKDGGAMLSRPTFMIWFISTVLVILLVLMVYGGTFIPVFTPIVAGHTFDVFLLAYLLLWLGTVFKGL